MSDSLSADQETVGPGALRARRLLWTRGVPGGAVMLAALVIPELSLGAGELGAGRREGAAPAPPVDTVRIPIKQRMAPVVRRPAEAPRIVAAAPKQARLALPDTRTVMTVSAATPVGKPPEPVTSPLPAGDAPTAGLAVPLPEPMPPGQGGAFAPDATGAGAAAVPAMAPVPAVRSPAPSASSPGSEMAAAPVDAAQMIARIDGKVAGKIDFQQTATGLSVRLGSIVEVLHADYTSEERARIAGSAASQSFLPLAELQAQGIPIRYDPVYDEFVLGPNDTRPTAAHKVHIDQISTPLRGATSRVAGEIKR